MAGYKRLEPRSIFAPLYIEGCTGWGFGDDDEDGPRLVHEDPRITPERRKEIERWEEKAREEHGILPTKVDKLINPWPEQINQTLDEIESAGNSIHDIYSAVVVGVIGEEVYISAYNRTGGLYTAISPKKAFQREVLLPGVRYALVQFKPAGQEDIHVTFLVPKEEVDPTKEPEKLWQVGILSKEEIYGNTLCPQDDYGIVKKRLEFAGWEQKYTGKFNGANYFRIRDNADNFCKDPKVSDIEKILLK